MERSFQITLKNAKMKLDKLTITNIQRIIAAYDQNAQDAAREIFKLYLESLERYSKFLEENGYIDWRNEEPFAIDEFMKQERTQK